MTDIQTPDTFEVVNSCGSAPVLIACDHAGNNIPDSMSMLGLDPTCLEQHIAYDIGAKQVAVELSALFDAPCLLAKHSRLLIDLNRHLDDPSLIATKSDGITIPGNQELEEKDRIRRVENYFNPYHKQYTEMVGSLIDRHEDPIILSIHSFTPNMNSQTRPWDFGVLWDKDEALADALIEGLSKLPNRIIGDNQPYHASDPQGYAQEVHAFERGVELALLEIRQDLITKYEEQAQIAKLLYDALEPIVNNWGRIKSSEHSPI